MRIKKLNQNGFHVIEFTIILVVLAAIGLVGFKVLNKKPVDSNKSETSTTKTVNNDPIKWAYNESENKWFTQTGTAPACKEPFKFDNTPVDLSLLSVIGMPGSYRGYNYKPHGALRADGSPDGKMDIKMPMDATLVGLKRYKEGTPETLQYLLTFESDCGIAFRFDHLYTLSPDFQKIAETTPEPTSDTRSDPNLPFARTSFKAGETIATAVGFPATKNFGFDFGVYDYRKPNEISKNSKWAAIHNQYQSLEWYGVCWLDMFPGDDAAKAKQLSLVVVNPAKPNIISDYCPNAPHNTLEFNNGQPTDG